MKILGNHDEKTIDQLERVAEDATKVALMADGHLGYNMPIGGVAAYEDKIPVWGVGYDIACGNCAVMLDLKYEDAIAPYRNDFADEMFNALTFGLGKKNQHPDAPREHEIFEYGAWNLIPETIDSSIPFKHEGMREKMTRNGMKAMARDQLGTIGAGNHYVDVFADHEDNVWIGAHFGSRGLGHTIASNFISIANGGRWGERSYSGEYTYLENGTVSFADYLDLMWLAGEYAHVGREWVVTMVAEMLGGKIRDKVHNHHNYAWREPVVVDEGELMCWVVRKGATPAGPGERGFVGGSMGDISVILRGSEKGRTELQQEIMFSTVHGAGRVMSRSMAKGKTKKDGTVVREPMVDRQKASEIIKSLDVVVRGGGLDEAPQAYRNLDLVLDSQGETIEVETELYPKIVCMAPDGERDW